MAKKNNIDNMAKRKLEKKLVRKEDINEELVPISLSNRDYITKSGQVYCDYGDGYFFPRKLKLNKANGYYYSQLYSKESGKIIERRTHRLLAEAFIPNDDPTNKTIVMHLDNDKSNLSLDNLKWGTVQENTQQAYDDGLAHTNSGFDDSQSIPIVEFDINGNVVKIHGSITLASKANGVTKGCVRCQCNHWIKHPEKEPRCGKYFRFLSEYMEKGFVL